MVEKLIGDRDNVKEVAAAIASLAKSYAYDGVVIDFEEIKGEALAKAHGDFLFELKETLGELTLITAVQPRDYYDGYDYARIGDISDGIILMAHDYNTKRLTEAERQMPYTMTPVAPIKDVYRALADISDPVGGIKEKDLHKVSLQISMGVAQWQIKDGYVLNAQPYTPTYDKVHNRLVQEGEGAIHYNMVLRSPKATYISEDGTENVIWYEDSRSVEEKLGLAAMFGIKDLSIWRLGNIPNYDDGSHLDILDTFLAK